jgi:hypothetical protein
MFASEILQQPASRLGSAGPCNVISFQHRLALLHTSSPSSESLSQEKDTEDQPEDRSHSSDVSYSDGGVASSHNSPLCGLFSYLIYSNRNRHIFATARHLEGLALFWVCHQVSQSIIDEHVTSPDPRDWVELAALNHALMQGSVLHVLATEVEATASSKEL